MLHADNVCPRNVEFIYIFFCFPSAHSQRMSAAQESLALHPRKKQPPARAQELSQAGFSLFLMEDRGERRIEQIVSRAKRTVGREGFFLGRKNACLRNAGDSLR